MSYFNEICFYYRLDISFIKGHHLTFGTSVLSSSYDKGISHFNFIIYFKKENIKYFITSFNDCGCVLHNFFITFQFLCLFLLFFFSISFIIVAFLFNWIGFLLLMCACHTVAGRYGALAGFGLSLAKWTLIVKHSTDLASNDNNW